MRISDWSSDGCSSDLVAPGQMPQYAVVMGVGRAAYVEYQVGIAGDAAFVRERFEGKNDRGPVGLDQIAHPTAQLPRGQVRCVDDMFLVAHGREQFALGVDEIGRAHV